MEKFQTIRYLNYVRRGIEWGCPKGTNTPRSNQFKLPQVMRLKPFYLTMRTSTDKQGGSSITPLTSLWGYKNGPQK